MLVFIRFIPRHFASHEVQNTNGTKKEKKKKVGDLGDGVQGVSTQEEFVLIDHLLNMGHELCFRKWRFPFFLRKVSLDLLQFQNTLLLIRFSIKPGGSVGIKALCQQLLESQNPGKIGGGLDGGVLFSLAWP